MIATTIEQSEKLIELGLDPRTADMVWVEEADGDHRLGVLNNIDALAEDEFHAWSLSALLDLIPKGEKDPYFTLTRGGYDGRGNYTENYFAYVESSDTDPESLFDSRDAETAVNAAFEMACWLLENKYI